MRRLLSCFVLCCLAACSTSRPVTPSPIPSPTFTPAPTSTSTPTPSPTPTLGPQLPASLSPENQDFLRAHADDPNVTWAFDSASGNTHVFINSDFDTTNPALAEQIKAQCRNGDCLADFDGGFGLMGKLTGDIEVIIDKDDGVEMVTSMVTVNHNNELILVKFRVILGTRNNVTEQLWDEFGISGDKANIEQLVEIFKARESLPLSFISSYHPESAYVKQYLSDYPKEYYEGVELWFAEGLNPNKVPELICTGLVEHF